LTKLSANAMRTEISNTSALLQQTAGFQPTFFRPPYGAINDEVQAQASSLGLTSTLWSVDPQDWTTPGTQVIINSVLNQVQNGSIILMHDGGGDRSQSIAALQTIIPTLRQRGYHFVTVQQLANDAGQTTTTTTTDLIAASINLPTLIADIDSNVKVLLIMVL
jgi:peptidoglycan-N-acetylglucosamine deacetylase